MDVCRVCWPVRCLAAHHVETMFLTALQRDSASQSQKLQSNFFCRLQMEIQRNKTIPADDRQQLLLWDTTQLSQGKNNQDWHCNFFSSSPYCHLEIKMILSQFLKKKKKKFHPHRLNLKYNLDSSSSRYVASKYWSYGPRLHTNTEQSEPDD